MSDAAVVSPHVDGLRRDTAVVTVCTLLSRVTGFGRVLATMAVLGAGALGDVYQTANLIPNLLFELVAAGVLQAVLVPSYVAARRAGGDEELTRAVRATAGVIFAVLAVVTIIGMALAPVLARLLVAAEPSAALADDKVDVMVPMVLVFVPQLLFYGLAMAVGAALNARGHFVAAALSPVVNNLVVITACLLFRASRDGAVADLDLTATQFALIAGGTTLGVVAFALAPTFALSRAGIGWLPQWRLQHPAVQAMRRQFGWATLSIIGTLVPTATALALGNGAPGGVAIFVYAFAFYVLPHALVAVPVATTLAPRVADRWQDEDLPAARHAIDSSMRLALPLLALGGAGMVGLAWPLARLFAFGQTATQGLAPIAHALAAFGPGLLGYGVAFVLMRVLFALGDVRRASLLTVAAAGAGVACMGALTVLMDPSERAAALAIGYGAAQTVGAALLIVRTHRITGSMGVGSTSRVLAESLAGGALAAAAMLAVTAVVPDSRAWSVVELLAAGTAGCAVFAAVFAWLRRDQVADWRRRRAG